MLSKGLVALTGILYLFCGTSIFYYHRGQLRKNHVAFSDFKLSFSKDYSTQSEHDYRFEVFQRNLQFIEAHNAQNHQVVLGVNIFADRTREEFLALIKKSNFKKSHHQPRTKIQYPSTDLAASMDWVAQGAVTPVKNQGACGSCWAFSTTGALEGLYAIKTGTLRQLSEQQFVDCGGKYEDVLSGCNGGLMDFAFDYADHHGVCTEESYRYQGVDQKCHLGQKVTKNHPAPNQCMVAIPPGEVTEFYDIPEASARGLMEALNHQPVSVGIQADSAIFQFYKAGVLTSSDCGGATPDDINHAVLAVGYGTTTQGINYWKVKNSWGPGWGIQGYILMGRDVSNKEGQCGILSSASVPKFQKGDFKDDPHQGPPLVDDGSTTDSDSWVSDDLVVTPL
jgi:KDEL-tailed cysteine endopeptidase